MSFFCDFLSPPESRNDQPLPAFHVIHSVSRAGVDSKFRDTLTHRLHVAWIPSRQPLDPDQDPCARPQVAEPVDPLGEDLGLSNLDISMCSQ